MPFAVAVVMGLLLGGPVSAPPRPAGTGAGARIIELGVQGAASALEVRLLPGHETGIRFDADILQGGVTVQQRERFAVMEVHARSIVLVPEDTLPAGERLRLTVPFVEDGAVPAQAVLTLVAHSTEVDAWVRVYRRPRPPAELEAELEATRARLAAALEEVRALRAQGPPTGLAGLWRSGLLGTAGIPCGRVALRGRPGGPLEGRFEDAWACRGAGTALVTVALYPLGEGAPPGEVVGATLKAASAPEARVLAVEWQSVMNARGDPVQWLVVEAALPLEASGPYTLELTGAEGAPLLRLDNVRFAAP